MASRAAVNVCRQWVVSQFEFCGLSDVDSYRLHHLFSVGDHLLEQGRDYVPKSAQGRTIKDARRCSEIIAARAYPVCDFASVSWRRSR